MAPRIETPSGEHRRLRVKLRQARDTAGFTQQEVAAALDWSRSKLIRIENGSVGISITDLRALAAHYGLTDELEVDSLVGMARVSKKSEWWEKYRHQTTDQFRSFLGIESSAIRIKQYHNLIVPGLLQSPRYIQKLHALACPPGEQERVSMEIRPRRQDRISSDVSPESFFIMDESVLYRRIGSVEIMREQLLRINRLSAHPKISIQVMPFLAGVHRGMNNSFEFLELSEEVDDHALLIERYAEDDQLIDMANDETRYFAQIFLEFEKVALSPEDSIRLIDRRIEELAMET
jgi:transcriptional regulator with XRE-family HTH domain